MSQSFPRIVLIGIEDTALNALAVQLQAAGFPTAVKPDTSNAGLPVPADIAIFLSHVPKEPRNKLAVKLRTSYPSLKIVMLYHDKISGTERADAVINAQGDLEDLRKTLLYLHSGIQESKPDPGRARGA